LASIAQLIRHSKRREMADGILLVTHTKDYSPFSWMRYIIVSEHDIQENYDMILAHERAHIQRGHSWDLLFAQLCATAQWFNPAAWLLKRELEAIHEYEADSATLHEGFDARQYQLRLFEAATGVKYSSFTNNFINCSTKKRIIMMMKKQTSPWARMKALFVLPVAFAAVTVISCTSPKEKKVEGQLSNVSVKGENPRLVFIFEDSTEIYIKGEQLNFDNHDANFDYLEPCGLTSENIDGISVLQGESAEAIFGESGKNGAILFRVKGKTAKDMTTALAEYAQRTGNEEPLKLSIKKPATIDDIQAVGYAPTAKANDPAAEQGEVFQVVEEQPMFPGGMQELMKFMQTNIRYPKEAQDRGIQGRVIVQFVVNKDGSISEECVVRSVDSQLDAEAIRIIRSMPNWTPGKQRGEPVRVRFTLPVTFRLS
jgi:TonB family protein